jgi:ERCC4-type nuclease
MSLLSIFQNTIYIYIEIVVPKLIEFIFSDDEDDTAELLAELQRIKKERAQEEARKVGNHFKKDNYREKHL